MDLDLDYDAFCGRLDTMRGRFPPLTPSVGFTQRILQAVHHDRLKRLQVDKSRLAITVCLGMLAALVWRAIHHEEKSYLASLLYS